MPAQNCLLSVALRDAFVLDLLVFIFAGLLLDCGALSGPLGLSSSVLLLYLVVRFIIVKVVSPQKMITPATRFVVVLSPFWVNIAGVVAAGIVCQFKGGG